jgi:hypothetical protein
MIDICRNRRLVPQMNCASAPDGVSAAGRRGQLLVEGCAHVCAAVQSHQHRAGENGEARGSTKRRIAFPAALAIQRRYEAARAERRFTCSSRLQGILAAHLPDALQAFSHINL